MRVKKPVEPLTVDEYLEGELNSTTRHEYVAGEVYAMTGASRHHNLIVGALHGALRACLRGGPCRVFMSDFKVRVDDSFYYPDVSVAGGGGGHEYYETEPVLIVEVLSPSTERQDRLEKRLAYQRLASLKEYVLVAQDKMRVEVYRRVENGWELEQFADDDVVTLDSIALELSMSEIYRDAMQAP